MDAYENVSRGSLKLKKVSDHKIKKKKKKKDKERELSKVYENMAAHAGSSREQPPMSAKVDKRTKAEILFEKAQEEKMAKEILQKAGKSHKEQIMDFNQHLDSLTEHFDIPKVSWTK